MGTQNRISDILALPAKDRLEIAEAIWESFAAIPDAVPIPDWHHALVQERLAADLGDETPPQSWDDVRRTIEKRP